MAKPKIETLIQVADHLWRYHGLGIIRPRDEKIDDPENARVHTAIAVIYETIGRMTGDSLRPRDDDDD